MADHVDQTIRDGCAEVDRLAAELVRKKIIVNGLCEMFGRPPVYQDVSQPEKASGLSQGRKDRYLGKPLATVLRQILSARHAANIGPATVDDLYTEMRSGTFDFGDKSEEDAKRGLAVSLTKNSKMFYRLPNSNLWGLPEWYGIKTGRGSQRAATNGDAPHLEIDEPDPEVKALEFGEPNGDDEIRLLPTPIAPAKG